MKSMTKVSRLFAITSLGAALVACGDGSDDFVSSVNTVPPGPEMATFAVGVTNLTNAQPLSPVAVIAHDDQYRVFAVGTTATVGLESLAEGGDNADLLAEAGATALATASGGGPIGPGANEVISVSVEVTQLPGLRLSAVTMLVNTNDAFAALNGMDVSGFAERDRVTRRVIAYDAGTELNDELATNIPGPAGGGEGFNAARNDRQDFVTMHQGVVSADDGFATSNLNESHRFDNPVAQIIITRTD
ncbi:MAG: spondin domain-containing protein [Pseudomonadota bacterium]